MNLRELLRRLKDDGWREVRTSGSHIQMQHPTKAGTITVAFHGRNADVPKGTARAILKAAGLEEK